MSTMTMNQEQVDLASAKEQVGIFDKHMPHVAISFL